MANYMIQDTTLAGIADAIRGKTGGAEAIAVTDMAAQIDGLNARVPELIRSLCERMTAVIQAELNEAEERTRSREQYVRQIAAARAFLQPELPAGGEESSEKGVPQLQPPEDTEKPAGDAVSGQDSPEAPGENGPAGEKSPKKNGDKKAKKSGRKS